MIACRAQRLRDGYRVVGQVPLVRAGLQGLGLDDDPGVLHHAAHAGLVGIQSREQAGPGGTAPRGIIETGVTQAARSQGIEVRRLDFAAVTADVRETHVVRHDKHDIGP